MNITVLGSGSVRRKQITTALDKIVGDEDPVFIYLEAYEDDDKRPDASRFAADWAEDKGLEPVTAGNDIACAVSADIVLIAWDDAQVDEIEEWVKATNGKVFDLTNDLAEISLEGEPDEAQQPSNSKPVVVPFQEPTEPEAPKKDSGGTLPQDEADELLVLGRAVKTLLDYVVARTNGSY